MKNTYIICYIYKFKVSLEIKNCQKEIAVWRNNRDQARNHCYNRNIYGHHRYNISHLLL